MSKAQKARTTKRPTLEEMLVHPIRTADNEAGSSNEECYEDWLLDHKKRARFYLAGFKKLRTITRETDAKHYHGFVKEALAIVVEEKWDGEIGVALSEPASYNQFRKAIISSEPMFIDLAVQVLAACECALADAINNGKYEGERFDIYNLMKIIPACFNIDSFNKRALEELREHIPNYDSAVLKAAGQSKRNILDALADGNCTTRKTARAIRSKTLELIDQYPNPKAKAKVELGNVRGYPGGKKLGRKNATTMEVVELDNLKAHQD